MFQLLLLVPVMVMVGGDGELVMVRAGVVRFPNYTRGSGNLTRVGGDGW